MQRADVKNVVILRHCPHEAIGSLERILGSRGLPLRFVECFDATWPEVERAGFDPAAVAGLVVMGGTMNVDQTDLFPFLATEVEWIRRAIAAELPVLGVCLGAQLLAKSLGAPVFPNPVREIGWYEIELLPAAHDDPLFRGSQPRETVFQWHGDTFELPAGAVQLARGATCAQQAFRYGPAAYALQFHLEITAQMISDWLREPSMCAEVEAADYIDPAEIRRRAPQALAAMAPLTARVLGRFAEACQARAGATV